MKKISRAINAFLYPGCSVVLVNKILIIIIMMKYRLFWCSLVFYDWFDIEKINTKSESKKRRFLMNRSLRTQFVVNWLFWSRFKWFKNQCFWKGIAIHNETLRYADCTISPTQLYCAGCDNSHIYNVLMDNSFSAAF